MNYVEIVREEAPYITQEWVVYVAHKNQKRNGELQYRQVYRCTARTDDEHQAILGYAMFTWERQDWTNKRDRNDRNYQWLLVLETTEQLTSRKAFACQTGDIPL